MRLLRWVGRLRPGTGWPRFLLGGVGLGFLGYGAVLAWHTRDTTTVLAVGAVFLFFALVLPSDWHDLTFGLPGGASVTIKREAQIAQETLASLLAALPVEARQALVRPEELAPELEQAPAPASPAVVDVTADARAAALVENLMNRQAFASHEAGGLGWIRLRLKRRTTPTEGGTGVTCAVRKPGGDFLVAVPRLIGSSDPPMIYGTFAHRGVWLEYEATFPDFFAPSDAELPEGTYTVVWGTVAPEGGRAHILATDSFEWPPTRE